MYFILIFLQATLPLLRYLKKLVREPATALSVERVVKGEVEAVS